MVTFGLDLSHHQSLGLDLARCRREGIEFVVLKSSEGASFVDAAFAPNLAEARAAGLLVAAYHYVRSDSSAAAQVANIRRVVPLNVPVIPDVEANSGGVALVREFVDRLRAAGYRVPVLYLPRWYWQQIGSPSLAGLPPLWSSRYPDNVVGSLSSEWSHVPASYWTGYGGLDVAVLQFTSSVAIGGYSPIDANAYRGTREQLAALFGGTPTKPKEDPLVKNLILAREKDSAAVWVGDGVTRRWVANETTLADYQYWIGQKGGDATIQSFANMDVLGAPIEMTVNALTNDEANIVAAIRALPAPGEVDENTFAASLAPLLAPLVSAGATPDQVEDAVRRVFASAGQPNEEGN
jgi:GH25 family lysozyme M1 (1,4-beta-N-acetylmuramidase)